MGTSVDIKSFIRKLIDNTETGSSSWEYHKDNSYRLLLKNGSVIFRLDNSDPLGAFYRINLYDSSQCFASYSVNPYSDSENIFNDLDLLYNAIMKSEKEKENKKIAMLYNDLL